MRFFFFLLVSSRLLAGSGTVKIISPREAAARLTEASVVDSRSASEFREGHLERSRRMDWKDWTEERPNFWNYLFGDSARWGKALADPASLGKRLSGMGLSSERPILVVGKPGEWGEEGRIAWNLLYWGADEVWLLDGGYPAWAKAKLPLSKGEEDSAPPAVFRVKLRPERRAMIPDVKAAQGKGRLLDVRSEEEYRGKTMPGQKRGGRIGDGRLVAVASLYRGDGTFVDAAQLKKLVGPSAEKPIAYCVGGVRSALLALLLEARLGILTANYDGSVWEWAADETLPMTKAP